jgi:hypothetical protein
MEKLMKEVHALVCHGSRLKESQVFVSMFEQLSIKASKCRMPKARCWATPQRWLLTLDMISFRAALWNPFNLDKVELPSLENNLPQNCKCLLSCEPVSPGCVVLVVDADEPVIWFCYVRGKKWTRHEYNIIVEKPWLPSFLSLKRRCEEQYQRRCSREEVSSEFILDGNCNGKRTRISSDAGHGMMAADPSERIQIRSIVAVERKFYFDMSPSKLGVLEFHPEPTFTTLEFKRLPIAEYSWESSSPHLVESRGRLFLAVRARGHHLYKMDFSRLAWSTVDCLYDQVFFLGRLHFTASYSAWELGLQQGNIYFLAHGEDGVVQLTNVFSPGDKYMPGSTYCPRTIDDLPASLLGIQNVLTKACGFAIGSS